MNTRYVSPSSSGSPLPASRSRWIVFSMVLLLVAGAAAPSSAGKDTDPSEKAIIKYLNENEGNIYFADMLWGIDLKNGKFLDTRTASLKVGIFAVQDSDGELKNIKYSKKVIYPDKDFKNGSVGTILRGVFYADLVKQFNKKLKTSKSTKDKVMKRQKLLRLLSWCDAHYLPGMKSKVEKELKRIDSEVMKEEKSGEIFNRTEEQDALVEQLKTLLDVETVHLAASDHITLASDFLPPKTLERMIKVGERIYRDFCELMYVDGVKDLREIPQGEILRMYYLTHTTTLEDILKQASKFGPGLSDTKHKESLKLNLMLGGVRMRTALHKKKSILTISFSALERRDRDDPSKITSNPPNADYTNHLVSTLGHTLMNNWLGHPPAFKNHIAMPWLAEGYAQYLCIKNLGVRGTSTVDFDFEYARRETGRGYSWVGDIEEMMHRIAHDPDADKFEDLIRITHFRNLKAESVAKSVSLIDFLMETNRIGFLNFLKDMQKLYRKLDKTGNQQVFISGLDPLVGKNFGGGEQDSGMASRLKKKSAILNSVADMERAWSDWTARWIKGKK